MGCRSSQENGQFGGSLPCLIEKHREPLQWCTQKQLNLSRCRLGNWLTWSQGRMGSRSTNPFATRGWQDGDAAFCQNSLTTCCIFVFDGPLNGCIVLLITIWINICASHTTTCLLSMQTLKNSCQPLGIKCSAALCVVQFILFAHCTVRLIARAVITIAG